MKYLKIAQLSWQTTFQYRISFVLWRLRQFLSSLMALTIWTVIFSGQESVFGYNQSQMISYVFLVNVLQSIILTTAQDGLADYIYSGNLSRDLVRPINVFAVIGVDDVMDKIENIFYVMIETVILYLIFRPELNFHFGLVVTLGLIFLVIGAEMLNFLITLLFGTMGFWSPQTWGPRFLFFMMVDFTAGKLFPLDILPDTLEKVLFFTPFPYLAFVQTQLFLGKMSLDQLPMMFSVLIFWVVSLWLIFKRIWQKGIKDYSAAGH